FSYSYVLDRSTIVVREGMSKNPEDYYKNDKVVVGAIQGSNFVQLWKDRAPNANMKLYQEYPDLMIALAQGKVDLMVVSEITGLDLIEKLGERAKGVVMGNPFLYDPQAIGLPQNDSKWRNWVNWALQRMWAEGILQTLYKTHYKVDPPFFPWENAQLQPRVLEVGDAKFDMWKK
ncbi:MAG: transporter substrate-binding domain-containing protein, partial [Rhodospirillales bacterium]|nr:transporter substrate-binding domain-containing protein [Rhodospirillales bacterium]